MPATKRRKKEASFSNRKRKRESRRDESDSNDGDDFESSRKKRRKYLRRGGEARSSGNLPPPNPDPPENFPGVNFENLVISSVLSSCEMLLNQTAISSVNDLYAITSYVTFLNTYSEDYRKSRGEMLGYEDESTADYFDCRKPSAYRSRALLFKDSKWVKFAGPLFTSFHFSTRFLIPMVPVHYRLFLADPKKCLKSSDTTRSFKYEIRDAKLILQRVTIADSLNVAIEKRLMTNNALYHYDNLKSTHFVIPSGVRSYAIADIFANSSFVPHEIIILAVTQSSALGK